MPASQFLAGIHQSKARRLQALRNSYPIEVEVNICQLEKLGFDITS